MARWKPRESASFEDMPQRLQDVDADSSPEQKQARADWLEGAGLSLVDLMAWRRAQDPLARLRPASRRKWLSAQERAELDERLEREGSPW